MLEKYSQINTYFHQAKDRNSIRHLKKDYQIHKDITQEFFTFHNMDIQNMDLEERKVFDEVNEDHGIPIEDQRIRNRFIKLAKSFAKDKIENKNLKWDLFQRCTKDFFKEKSKERQELKCKQEEEQKLRKEEECKKYGVKYETYQKMDKVKSFVDATFYISLISTVTFGLYIGISNFDIFSFMI